MSRPPTPLLDQIKDAIRSELREQADQVAIDRAVTLAAAMIAEGIIHEDEIPKRAVAILDGIEDLIVEKLR